MSLVIYNPQLLPKLYEERPDSGLNISKILIEDGLLSNSLYMRPLFKDQIQFIVDTIKTDEESGFQKPFIFILRKMLSVLDLTVTRTKDARQFY